MKTILKGIVTSLFCLIGSTVFSQQNARENKIYIPQSAIKIESGNIIIRKNNNGIKVKAIHSNQHGFYIYKNDVLLPKTRIKGDHLYGCTKCSRVFNNYEDADLHTWEKHRGFAEVRKIRQCRE